MKYRAPCEVANCVVCVNPAKRPSFLKKQKQKNNVFFVCVCHGQLGTKPLISRMKAAELSSSAVSFPVRIPNPDMLVL